jgi:transcriptional regulator with XRE-family HTH domain
VHGISHSRAVHGGGRPEMTTELGQRLRDCRKSAGMTQPVLGEALGLSRNQVSAIERGQSLPPDSVIRNWVFAGGGTEEQGAELIELARGSLRPVHVEPDQPLTAPDPAAHQGGKRWDRPLGATGLPVVHVELDG